MDKEYESIFNPQPIGCGSFGNIYDQFRGKAKEAVCFLLTIKSGEALAALRHDEIGDISIVYGNEKCGLEKIVNKHPEVVYRLQDWNPYFILRWLVVTMKMSQEIRGY